MNDMKREWIKPTLTKVKLEFDKEMSNNCSQSANPSKDNCGHHPGCWSNPHQENGGQS
jgi:hypothetical protein